MGIKKKFLFHFAHFFTGLTFNTFKLQETFDTLEVNFLDFFKLFGQKLSLTSKILIISCLSYCIKFQKCFTDPLTLRLWLYIKNFIKVAYK